MTNEERDLITRFIERVGGVQAPGQAVAGQGAMAPLPAVDRDADGLIAELFNRYPEARYRVTQLAFVQEHALVEAQNRIARLQWELQNARQAAPQQQPGGASPWGAAAGGAAAAAAQPAQSRGFFSSLFNGGPQAAPPPQYAPQPAYSQPPPPQYPPGYNPGAFQQPQGTGFLGGALRTAAGVAGGVVAADALMSLFSGNHGGGFGGGGFGGGGFGGGGFGGPEYIAGGPTIIESPWGGGGGAGVDPYDQGGAPKDDGKFDGPAQVDQSAWAPAPDQSTGGGWQQADAGPADGGWQDAPSDSGDQGGGWDQASNDSGGGSDWQDT